MSNFVSRFSLNADPCFYAAVLQKYTFGQAYQYLRHANTAGRKPVTIRLHFPGRSGQCSCCTWGRGRDVAEVVTAAQGHARGEVLVFTSSRASCEDLRSKIAAADTEAVVEVYHAGQALRFAALRRFCKGGVVLL